MSKTKKILPKLRFPEFKNDGEWEEITLGQLSKILKGKQLNRIELTETGKYPCLNGGINPSGYTDKFNTKENTITISEGGNSCGYVNYMTSKFWLGGHCYKLLVNDKIEKIYLYQALKFNEEEIMKLRVGSGLPNIQLNSINNFKFVISNSLPEQQRIAACLSSLDELISAHSQKLELLKAHKKGLMQNLFPQEGKKVPKLRFPEFKDCGEWEEETLGKVYDFKSTNSLSWEHLSYEKGIVKNIHYGDIHTTFSTLFDITKEKVPYIKHCVPVKIKKDNYCIERDIIFADASENIDDIGKSIEIINLNNEKLVSGLHTLLARQRKQKLAIGFGGYLFKSDWVRKQIQREAQGAKVLGISATRISRIRILFPQNIIEQQKIASCLSSLDELITAQSKKIEQLKQHKKGLMQGLFPKINE